MGSLPSNVIALGTAFVVSQGTYLSGVSNILEINEAGQVVNTIPITTGLSYTVGEVRLSPFNNELYVGVTLNNPFVTGPALITGELLELDPSTGKLLNTISLPPDQWITATELLFFPFAFDPASDGTFWVSQPNSNNILHIRRLGKVRVHLLDGEHISCTHRFKRHSVLLHQQYPQRAFLAQSC